MEPLRSLPLEQLLQLVSGLTLVGRLPVSISGLSLHSKKITPGDLFVAKKGTHQDGASYAKDAIEAGAAALLVEQPLKNCPIPQLVHSDITFALERIVDYFYESPSKKLKVVGITGTNGKTTSSYLLKHLLDQTGLSSGLIGTIETIVGERRLPSTLTTPDLITTQKLLAEMVDKGQKAAVMEVSSHALDQGRVAGIDFSAALFTNLTQDHLDYHKTMDAYAAAKRKLFANLGQNKTALINGDDPWAPTFISPGRRWTYGIETENVDIRATSLRLDQQGSEFSVHAGGKSCLVRSSLIGRFNVYNLLGVISVGLALGLSLEDCASALSSFQRVPGRLSRVPNPLSLSIFVDYAHTEDALEKVLLSLREFKTGKLITLFGCGGERDQGKRPQMGRVAERLSDQVIVSSDNPRSEDPLQIIREICSGMERVPLIEPDREIAIIKALELAEPGDIVLIAGKGHEKTQQIGSIFHPFDDFEVAKNAAEALARVE